MEKVNLAEYLTFQILFNENGEYNENGYGEYIYITCNFQTVIQGTKKTNNALSHYILYLPVQVHCTSSFPLIQISTLEKNPTYLSKPRLIIVVNMAKCQFYRHVQFISHKCSNQMTTKKGFVSVTMVTVCELGKNSEFLEFLTCMHYLLICIYKDNWL